MKKIYLLLSGIILISSSAWSQCTISGSVSPTCENGAIQTLTTTGNFLLGSGLSGNTFNPSLAGTGTHIIDAYDISNGYTYTVNTTGTFAPVPSAGTPVTLGDDAITGLLPIGFNFTFFGNTYSDFVISSNGFISFDAGVSQGCCQGEILPTNDAVNNVIAYHWNDLYPPGGGSITYETVGIAPSRRLLVTFTNQSHCCNTTGGNTAQIILYETLNVIEMHTTSATNDGSLATQGIENANGTVGYTTPGRNSTVWTTTNDYVAFIPGAICATTSIVVNGSSVGTDVVSACGSFTWIDNVTYTTSNSSATYTLTGGNSVGCDSIVTLNLTINTIDNTVTNSSPTLTSNQLGATYQWLDCDNNFSIISGETAQSYLVTTTGNYAVEITLGGCVDTSACENVIINSIKEITNIGISVYPNPTSGLFTISLDGTQNEALNYSILNLEGKTVKQANNVTDKKIIIDISSESKGVYFLKIYKENTTNVYKIIKQ